MLNHQAVGFAEICLQAYANGCTKQPVPFLEGIGQALINKITTDLIAKGFEELCSDAEIDNKLSHEAHQNWALMKQNALFFFVKSLSDSYSHCYDASNQITVTSVFSTPLPM